MVDAVIAAVTVRQEGAGEILGDVHQLVNEDPGLVISRQFIKIVGDDFDDVVGFEVKPQLPNAGQAPDTGAGAGSRAVGAKADDAGWVDVDQLKSPNDTLELTMNIRSRFKV